VPRNHHLGIRFAPSELDAVISAAAALGKRPAAWLRDLALGAVDVAPSIAPPTSAERLTQPVSTRLTPEQHDWLEAAAAACGLPLAAYVRRLVLGATATPRPHRASVRAAIAALNRVGNNLNQIAKKANQGVPVVPSEVAAIVAEVLEEVRNIRDAVLGADA